MIFKDNVSDIFCLKVTIISAFLVLLFSATSQAQFSNLDPHDIANYDSFVDEARGPIRDYFTSLKAEGIIQSVVFTGNGINSAIDGTLVAQFQIPIKAGLSCNAVFCKDPELLARIVSEIQQGRLILVTHNFTGFSALAIAHFNNLLEPTTGMRKLRQFFEKSISNKSVIIISPSVTLDTFEHELIHTADHESGKYIQINSLVVELLRAGKVNRNTAMDLNSFINESRAYEHQRNFIENSTREKEWNAKNDDDKIQTNIAEVAAKNYVETRIIHIDKVVKKVYFDLFLEALKESELDKTARYKLLAHVAKFIPQEGPFSYHELVEPLLRAP